MTINEIKEKLEKTGYIANEDILYAISGTLNEKTPLLIEGDPGCGKTYLAKAVAEMLNTKLIRVQFYDGITPDKILYDYDYQKQLLSIEAIRSTLNNSMKNMTPEEAMEKAGSINFYGKNFLIKRPVLQALTEDKAPVLLLDEIDKSSEELEYSLLEILDEFSMTIPQYGTITCPEEKRPYVFLTSNRCRELSDALRRRCSYLYIDNKTEDEIREIIKRQTNLDEEQAKNAAKCLAALQGPYSDLKQKPSIAEGIEWTKHIEQNKDEKPVESIYMLAKNKHDRDILKQIMTTDMTFIANANNVKETTTKTKTMEMAEEIASLPQMFGWMDKNKS